MLVILLFVVAWAAFVVSAVAGGGAGLVLVPLLRTIVPIASVPAALSIGTAASSLSRIMLFRHAIRWDVVRRFVPAALPATALGAWLLSRFEPAYVELILACFLLANLPSLLRAPRPDRGAPALPLTRVPLVGAAAGLLSGFTGAVGLVFNGVYQRLGMSRHEIVATRATNEVLLHLVKLGLYAWFGLLGPAALLAGGLVALAAVLASVSLRWILPLVRESLFRRVGQSAMVLSGAAMFMLSSTQIAALHRAWVAIVSPGGEHEVQFYWQGGRRLALEYEPEGTMALERTIPFEAMPPAVRRAALTVAPRAAIWLVEEVRSPAGIGYEIYHISGRVERKTELTEGPNGVAISS